MGSVRSPPLGLIALAGLLAALVAMGLLAAAPLLVANVSASSLCSGSVGGVALTGAGQVVGATEYGGPSDPSSGTVGSSGVDLTTHPASYAELGGVTFATATAMGGLPYETPLRISWDGHSVIAYKRDIGLGGGPIDGHPRVIDLWWELAGELDIPYDGGEWSGLVKVARVPSTGAGNLLDDVPPQQSDAAAAPCAGAQPVSGLVPVTSGPRAVLLANGLAAAPQSAPESVKGIIAAGNEIVGKPYVYGGGHGLPLSDVATAYDCSSSVAHLLYGGGLLPVTADLTSTDFESWGAPGPGQWVTIYASAAHVFMYVAGLRWDTHNAAGADDGSDGIGWHPLVRNADGFVARHPVGL